MSATQIEILSKFKNSIVAFLDELIEQFPLEGDLVILRIFLSDQVPIMDIMKKFSERALPIKEMVKSRDQSFFIENDVLFSDVNTSKVSYFKELWMSSKLDDEDRDTIWRWFDLFINLAERYSKISK